ncbi:MAG TPA: hypothetical protein VGB14_16735 [Acidimicrobiales bacterium]
MRRPGAARAVGAVLVLAVGLLGGCGGDDVDPAEDRERAEAAVLTLEDLPDGFVEAEPDEDAENDRAEACLEASGQDVTADEVDEARTAEVTREFDAEQGANVQAEISVFDDEDVPAALIEVLGDDEALQCLVDALRDEGLGEDEALTVEGVAVGEAPAIAGDVGDQRGAARLEVAIAHSSGQRFEFVSDLYAVRVDRAVATLTVTQLSGQELAGDDVQAALGAMATRLAEEG